MHRPCQHFISYLSKNGELKKNISCSKLRKKLRRGFERYFDEFDVCDHHSNLINQDGVNSMAYYDIGSVDVDDDGREEKWSGHEDEDANRDWERLERPVGCPFTGNVNDDSKLEAAANSEPRATQHGESDAELPRGINWRPHRALIYKRRLSQTGQKILILRL